MIARQGPYTLWRQKLAFVQQVSQYPFQASLRWYRQQPAATAVSVRRSARFAPVIRSIAVCDMPPQIRAMFEEPLHSFAKARQSIDLVLLQHLDRAGGP